MATSHTRVRAAKMPAPFQTRAGARVGLCGSSTVPIMRKVIGGRFRVRSAACISPQTACDLPVVDLSDVLTGQSPSKHIQRQVRAACEDTGFLIVSSHGVQMARLRDAMAASKAFFDLPLAAKQQYVVDGMRAGRGYEVSPEHRAFQEASAAAAREDPDAARRLAGHPEPSVRQHLMSERFLCGPAAAPAADAVAEDLRELLPVFFARNVWPNEVPAMRPLMESCYSDLARLSSLLLRVFAASLGEREDFFEAKIDCQHSNMQVANYSSQVLEPPGGCMRKKDHVDSGTLTILASDNWLPGSTWQVGQGGLQLLDRDGCWREIHVPPGCLLVNLGTLMTRWTNGQWQSTRHRVTNPAPAVAADSRRMSVAFFHKVNLDTVVEVLAGCIPAGGRARFAPIMAKDLTRQGLLWKFRHLPAEEASAAYHAELARLSEDASDK